jgi:hypothetical protein
MVRPSALVVAISLCLWTSGCGSNPATPSAANYEGKWSGATAQGSPISFTISADEKVTSITVGYSFNGCSGTQTFSNLNLDLAPDVTCIPGPCPAGVMSFRGFGYGAASADGSLTSVNGLFPFPGRAQGVVAFTNYPACGTALGVAWTARR